ncbi:TIGR02678 family protein [Paenibacillaceae sp. P-4]|uniref:TIGR02678 family protein n=1 Tax=Paenibacillaceae bacterium P-4 TaxID=3160969 RepID=UPI0032E847B2
METIKIGKLHTKRRRTNIVDKDELTNRKKQCMNALLNLPWITKDSDPQLYYWIKEQYTELRDWFMNYTGYSLIVNRKIAKLEKVPVIAYPWMGFQEFREPLDYALFTYSLWFLEAKTEREQFLLTDLVKEVRDFMFEQGMEVDWRNYFHRLSMARALKKLKSLDVIRAVDGQEADWASNIDDEVEKHNVLYECSAYVRYVLRNFPRELMSYTDMTEMRDTIDYKENTDEINQKRKHYLYRRYLLEPVVLDDQWQEDPLYFHGQKNYVINQLKTMFGWEGSKYREGIIFFEPEMTTDAEVFPTLSSISDISLLVFGHIRKQAASEEVMKQNARIHLTKHEMERILIRLKEEHGEYWTNEHRKMKSAQLAEQVLDHVMEWGFGEWVDETFFVLNAAAGKWIAQYGTADLDT